MLPAGSPSPAQAGEERGESARLSSFVGAMALGDLVKSTLGPKVRSLLSQHVLRLPSTRADAPRSQRKAAASWSSERAARPSSRQLTTTRLLRMYSASFAFARA